MTALLYILSASVSQALSVHAIRDIQANSVNIYRSVVWNYVVSAGLGFIYMAVTGFDPVWIKAIPYGVFTGFFYLASLLLIIRSMGQRGLAVTIAIANISMVMPVLIAVLMGERPSMVQSSGIILAIIAIPILSLCTAKGTAIHQAPSLGLAILLFIVRGLAATGNLYANKMLPPSAIPSYLTFLFGSCLIFGLITLMFVPKESSKIDVRLGMIFGVLNILATFTLMFALTKVPGSLVFASYSAIGLALAALIAISFWRERIQSWGWIGFGLAAIATVMMHYH